MDKIAVIYWSGTGNTEAMAAAVAEGIRKAGGETALLSVSDPAASGASSYDKLALGCPAMGNEVLEESEFEPFFDSISGALSGKKLVLFGSYDWGDGEWMRSWKERCISLGAVLAAEPVIANTTPDEDALGSCRELGAILATA